MHASVNCAKTLILWASTIDPRFCLRLPSCCPGFESQAHHLRFYQFIFELCDVKRTKINKKGAGNGPRIRRQNLCPIRPFSLLHSFPFLFVWRARSSPFNFPYMSICQSVVLRWACASTYLSFCLPICLHLHLCSYLAI